jgi:hypothetical protein
LTLGPHLAHTRARDVPRTGERLYRSDIRIVHRSTTLPAVPDDVCCESTSPNRQQWEREIQLPLLHLLPQPSPQKHVSSRVGRVACSSDCRLQLGFGIDTHSHTVDDQHDTVCCSAAGVWGRCGHGRAASTRRSSGYSRSPAQHHICRWAEGRAGTGLRRLQHVRVGISRRLGGDTSPMLLRSSHCVMLRCVMLLS